MTAVRYLVQSRRQQHVDTEQWLTSGERKALALLTVPKRRDDWMLGRWTAKRALAAYLNLDEPMRRLEIRAADDGAPQAFVDGAPAGVVISLSHSADRAICAIADRGAQLGCDLERIEDRSAGFIETFFTSREQRLCADADPAQLPLLATLIWSAKESALKAMRQGLRLDTRRVEVRPGLASRQSWQMLEVRQSEQESQMTGWWRQQDNFVICIVTTLPDPVPPEPLEHT